MGYVITKVGEYLLVVDATSSQSIPLPVLVKTVGSSNVNICSATDPNDVLLASAVSDYTTIDGVAALTTAIGVAGQLNALCADTAPAGSATSWVGNLAQDGTDDPEAVEVKNNTGATVVWTRSAEGVFLGTASSPIFTAGQVTFALGNGSTGKEVAIAHTSTTVVTISQTVAGVADDVISNLSVAIYIWS